MDFSTSLKLLQRQVARLSEDDESLQSIALIDAMDFYKGKQWGFNQGWQQMFFLKGVDRYNSLVSPPGFPLMRPGMPHGIIRPLVIQIVALVTSGDPQTGTGLFSYQKVHQAPLIQVTVEEMWEMRGGPGALAVGTSGYPTYFCWLDGADTTESGIRIHPAPSADMVADFFYVKDAFRPRYRWNNGEWTFEQLKVNNFNSPDFWMWVTLEPTFTNVWLEHAEPLIRHRAIYDLQSNFYHDGEAAQIGQAQMFEQERRLNEERVSGIVGTLRRVPSCL